jgi:hypothetical protein
MLTTITELQQLFKLDDDRQIKRGLVHKIEVFSSDRVKIKDEELKELVRRCRESEVLDTKEVCRLYKISREQLMSMIRDKMIPYFKLVDSQGSKYLFLKSDLDKGNKIFVYYSKQGRRETLIEVGDRILAFMHTVGRISEQECVIYKMYYLDLLIVEEIAELQKMRPAKVQQILRQSHYRICHWLLDGIKKYSGQQTFEERYYQSVRENGILKKRIAELEPKQPESLIIPVEKLSTSIYDMNLSVRAMNVLRYLDIMTLQDLVCFPKEKLLEVRKVGTKTIKEIEKVLNDAGIKY